MPPPPPAAPAPRRRFLLPALAGTLLAWTTLRLLGGTEALPAPPPRASSDLAPPELLQPVGSVSYWGLFRWLGEPPAGGSFELAIFDVEDPDAAPVVEEPVDEPYWSVDEVVAAGLGDELRWEVRLLDEDGRRLASSEARAWLEPYPLLEPATRSEGAQESGRGRGPRADKVLEPLHDAAVEAARILTDEAEPADVPSLLEPLAAGWEAYLAEERALPPLPPGAHFLDTRRRRTVLETLLELEIARRPGPEGARRALERLYSAQTLDGLVGAEPPGGLDEALAVLTHGGGAVLCYVPGDGRAVGLVCTDADAVAFEVRFDLELERGRRALVAALRTPENPARAEALEEAGQSVAAGMIPAGVAKRLGRAEHVTVIGADALGDVPFELLVLPDGRTLEETCAVSYLPSLPAAVILHERRANAAERARALGLLLAPDYSRSVRTAWKDPARIEHTKTDRERLRSGLRAGEVLTLEGKAVNLEGLVRASRNARTLHLVTHGVLDTARRRPLCLLLGLCGANRGVVGARELEGLGAFTTPPLVRISTCATGTPRAPGGSAALAEAFLRAGTDVVLLSPGDLDFATVTGMSPSLHAGLFDEEMPPAAAVRKARLALRAEHDAAFGLVHTFGLGGLALR